MIRKKIIAIMLALGMVSSTIPPVSVSAEETSTSETEQQLETTESASQQEQPTQQVQTADQQEMTTQEATIENAETEDNTDVPDLAKWTIKVYLCGADLESGGGAATEDIMEMLRAKGIDSNKVNIVIETGGSMRWFMDDAEAAVQGEQICSEANIDENKIQRYHIVYDGGEYGMLQLDNNEDSQKNIDIANGIGNMGDQAEFTDFLEYCDRYYPAEHSAVVLWNHGGGSIGGVCFDENTDGDSLSLMELKGALAQEQADTGTKAHDLIGFDACLMGSFETALALTPYSHYVVGSQNLEPGYGWYYTDFLNALGEDEDNYTGEQMGEDIITAYEAFYRADQGEQADADTTMALYDMTYATQLRENFDQMAKELTYIINDSEIRSGLTSAIDANVMELDTGADMCDMIQFLNCSIDYMTLQQSAIEDLKEVHMDLARTKLSTLGHIKRFLGYAQQLRNYLVKDSDTDTEATVLKNYSGYGEGRYVNCQGISFYYPRINSAYTTTAVDDVYTQLGISEHYANYTYMLAYLIDGQQTFQGSRNDFIPYYDGDDRVFKLNTKGKNINSVDRFLAYENITIKNKKYMTFVNEMVEQKKDLYAMVPDSSYFVLGNTPILVEAQEGYYYAEGSIDETPACFYFTWDDNGDMVVTDVFDEENQVYYNCMDGFGDILKVGSKVTMQCAIASGDEWNYQDSQVFEVKKERTCELGGTKFSIPDIALRIKDAQSTGCEKTYQFALRDRKGNTYRLADCRYTRLLAFSEAKVTVAKTKTYTGKAIRPAVKVKSGSVTFKEGKDYTVTYKNNTKIGKASIQIKGINDCAGISYKKTFQIKAISMKAASIKVSKISTQLYTGKAVRPALRVKYGKKYLTEGRDYKVTYKNNKKVGKATAIITGKGVYSGVIKKTFKIVKRK